ncbi:MAG: hypothetical protein ACTSRZ_00575 [Promethearchaeota archaeon]
MSRESNIKSNSEDINSFPDNFPDVIKALDNLLQKLIECFDNIGIIDDEENENTFFKLVGKYSKMIKIMLNIYFNSSRKIQLEYKPEILYYRQVQGYLVFLLRFPDILKVKDHDEIQQTKRFMQEKQRLVKNLYKNLADEQTFLFESDFREKLDEKIQKMIDQKEKSQKN